MHILEMHICAYSVLHISAYFFAYTCIWIFAYKCIFVICIFLYIIAYKHIYCIFHLCILCIFSAYLVLHILAYFEMLISASIMHIYAYAEFACICVIYISIRHSLEQSGDLGFCGRFGACFKVSRDWRKKHDSVIGGLALTASDQSSVGVLVDCRYLRLACRVVDLGLSVLLFLKLGQ